MDKIEHLATDSSNVETQQRSLKPESFIRKADDEEAPLISEQVQPGFQQSCYVDTTVSYSSNEIGPSSEQELCQSRPSNTPVDFDIHLREEHSSSSQLGEQPSAQNRPSNVQDLGNNEVPTGFSQPPYLNYTPPRPQEFYRYHVQDPSLQRELVHPFELSESQAQRPHNYYNQNPSLFQSEIRPPYSGATRPQGPYPHQVPPQTVSHGVANVFGQNNPDVRTHGVTAVSPPEPITAVHVSDPNRQHHLPPRVHSVYKGDSNISDAYFPPPHGCVQSHVTSHSHNIGAYPSTLAVGNPILVHGKRPPDSDLTYDYGDRLPSQRLHATVSVPGIEQDLLTSNNPSGNSARKKYQELSDVHPEVNYQGVASRSTFSPHAQYGDQGPSFHETLPYLGIPSQELFENTPLRRQRESLLHHGQPQPGLCPPQVPPPPTYSSVHRAREASVRYNQPQLEYYRNQFQKPEYPSEDRESQTTVQHKSQLEYDSVSDPIEASVHHNESYTRDVKYPPEYYREAVSHPTPTNSRNDEPSIPPPAYSSLHKPTESLEHYNPPLAYRTTPPAQQSGALIPTPTHSNIPESSSALTPVANQGSQVTNPRPDGLQYGPPALRQVPQSQVTTYNFNSDTVSLSGNVTVEHPELKTLKSRTLELLNKSCPNFVETTAYHQARLILDRCGHVTLIGEPGSGKTTIAHKLLKSSKGSFMPLIIEEPSELRLRDPKEPTLVLFNDIFGKASYSKTFDDFLSLFEKLTKTMSQKRFRVVFTSRNYIFSDAKKDFVLYQDSLFNENSIVDLSGDDSLIKSDKKEILKSFLKRENITLSKEEVETIVSMKASYGFPHACLLFSTMKRWHLKPVEFFKKPIDVVIESLQHMYSKDKERFTVFLLLLMSKGIVNIAKMRKVSNISEEVKDFIGENVVRSFVHNRHDHVQALLGCYLNANGDTYSFRHPTVEDAVAFVVGNKDPLFLIENCSMSVIGERVRIHTTAGKGTQEDTQWFHVILSDDYHEDLVKRFVKEIKEKNFSMVCLHQACSQERFVDELFETLRKEEDYNQLMHNYDLQFNQNMLYWCAMNKSDVMFCKIVENTMFRPYEEHNAIIVCCMTGNTDQLRTLLRRLTPERKEKLLRMSITRRGIVIKQEDFKKHKMLDDKLLNIAARHGHKDVVDMLVEAGFSVNGEKNGIPPLHSCCESGHVNILVRLHQLGAQLDGKRFDSKTPLHIACQNGHLSMVMKCVELGASVTSLDRFGQTPLLLACENGHEDIAKYFLNHCPLTEEVEYGEVLYYACQGGCVDVVKDILTNKVNGLQENYNRWGNLLHRTAQRKSGHDIEDRKLEIIKFLLEKDIDVNIEDDFRNTPLLIAAESGYLKIVNILIEKGAQMSAINDDGQTYLHKAAEGNLLHKLKYPPIDLKENIDETDGNGQTPLHRAAMSEATQSITYLLRNEANINAVDMSNLTPLHIAAVNADGSAVKVLLDEKAVVDPRNDCDMTPLHSATAEGRLETTQILLQHKADVNATDISGQTPLHFASSTWIGGVDVVQLLLANKADVHAKNNEGRTPLHLSTGTWGRVDTTQALLDHLSDVNAQDESMHTPLHLASLKGHVDVIQLLVDRGADVEATDNMKQTALHLAAENSDPMTVQALLDCKANVNAADKNCQTPLHLASTVGQQDNVALILKAADMYAQDNTGETALHAAAVEGMTGSIEVLVVNGMNINIQDYAGNTPLHTCCVNGRPEATELLLNKGADTTAKDKHLRTPLHRAAECDRPFSDVIVNMLLDHNSDVNAKDDEGKYPLHYAAMKGLCESMQVLLRYGSDINAKDSISNTPLHHAVAASRCDIVQELLHSNALCDIMDVNGNLAIHLAAKLPQTDVIKIMLRNKVDIDARDVDMKTALHIATSCGNARMVKILIVKGADVNATDSQNETPLHCAVVKGNNNIVQHLIVSKMKLNTADVQSAMDLAKEGGNLKAVTLLSQYLSQQS